jgi:uncharacterized phage-like protein YoqJ
MTESEPHYIMVTGHRPNAIGGYSNTNPIRQYIKQKMKRRLQELQAEHPNLIGISGMALGVDQDFCDICIELGIPFHAYVPFVGQSKVWPKPLRDYYDYLLSKAAKVIIVSEGTYSPYKMHVRNHRMSDACTTAIAVLDPNKSGGGTFKCVQYLVKINKEIYRIDPHGN